MNLVKGIAVVVGLGGIATAIGLGVSSSSSSQTPEIPKLKKLTSRDNWESEGFNFLSFDGDRDSWNKRFTEYQGISADRFKAPVVKDVEEFKDRCKSLLDSGDDDRGRFLAWRWCTPYAW